MLLLYAAAGFLRARARVALRSEVGRKYCLYLYNTCSLQICLKPATKWGNLNKRTPIKRRLDSPVNLYSNLEKLFFKKLQASRVASIIIKID